MQDHVQLKALYIPPFSKIGYSDKDKFTVFKQRNNTLDYSSLYTIILKLTLVGCIY